MGWILLSTLQGLEKEVASSSLNSYQSQKRSYVAPLKEYLISCNLWADISENQTQHLMVCVTELQTMLKSQLHQYLMFKSGHWEVEFLIFEKEKSSWTQTKPRHLHP